jgi:hypothetical protein
VLEFILFGHTRLRPIFDFLNLDFLNLDFYGYEIWLRMLRLRVLCLTASVDNSEDARHKK